MKLRKLSQAVLAAAVGVGACFGLTSCVQSHTIGYFYVTGAQYNQVQAFKINNNYGNLTSVGLVSSGGVNPVDAIVTQSGQYLYVLNAGCADPAVFPNAKYVCGSGQTPTNSSISLFTIGGNGVLTFQQSYSSHGLNSVTISTDSTGAYMYVLDQNVPQTINTPAQYLNDGDVSVFSINPSTGRLSALQNQQVQDNTGAQLLYFPVGVAPIWFRQAGSYLYTIDHNTGPASSNPTYVSVYSVGTGGQLQVTQNSEFPTGATKLVYIYSAGSYIYLLDQGEPTVPTSPLYNGAILIYTSGTNGALTSITSGTQLQSQLQYTSSVGPTVLVQEGSGGSTYLYVANNGNLSPSQPASNISSYFVTPGTGQLSVVNGGTINTGIGSGPSCILVDPSNQFLFTANFATNNITGKIINTQAGTLTQLRAGNAGEFSGPGQPTWCVASGTTF